MQVGDPGLEVHCEKEGTGEAATYYGGWGWVTRLLNSLSVKLRSHLDMVNEEVGHNAVLPVRRLLPWILIFDWPPCQEGGSHRVSKERRLQQTRMVQRQTLFLLKSRG